MWLNSVFIIFFQDIKAKRVLFSAIGVACFFLTYKTVFEESIVVVAYGSQAYTNCILPAFSLLFTILLKVSFGSMRIFFYKSRKSFFRHLMIRSFLLVCLFTVFYVATIIIFCIYAQQRVEWGHLIWGSVTMLSCLWMLLTFATLLFVKWEKIILTMISFLVVLLIDMTMDVYYMKSIIMNRIFLFAELKFSLSELLLQVAPMWGVSILLFIIGEWVMIRKNFYV